MKKNNEISLLITGGTGSFGKAFLSNLFKKMPDIKRVVIFSRDEMKQWEMQRLYPPEKYPQLRFFLGDIRDKDRLQIALNGINTVVHAAALKHVPAGEYNPSEFIKTNVGGAQNLVRACLNTDVENLVALSTDKAASPINLYGATKLCSDKLFIAANNIKGHKKIKFSIVRYGNVMGSRGSVVPFFIEKAKSGTIPITDSNMTRFNITLNEGVELVFWALKNALGGEIFVPKIPSYNILDIANAIGPNCKKEIIGIRPGEKIHEELVTKADGPNTIDIGNYYVILPSDNNLRDLYLQKNKDVKTLPIDFIYDSFSNHNYLTIEEIRNLIKINISKSFKPF